MVSSSLKFTHTVTERFLRYVVIDTQSDPASPTCPSTEKQKDLGRLLAAELRRWVCRRPSRRIRLRLRDDPGEYRQAGPGDLLLLAHGHLARLHRQGRQAADRQELSRRRHRAARRPHAVIRAAEHPALADQIGNDIVTTDGTTLLGADNKAGLAEIMDAAHFLINNPQIKHGAIKILFTPDEEIGRGVDKADLKKLGADFAYTIDGESAGNIEDETFSADGATITIEGVSTHPGFAKGKMEHAIKIAAAIVDRLPKDTCSPETTEGKEGFLHPVGISGALEKATLEFHRARFHR